MAAQAQQPPREAIALTHVAARLQTEFPSVSPADVEAVVRQHYARLADSRIRDFLPVLVERGARDELSQRAPHPTE